MKRRAYHDVASAIREVKETGGDAYAGAPEVHGHDPDYWHGYFKWDSEQHGTPP